MTVSIQSASSADYFELMRVLDSWMGAAHAHSHHLHNFIHFPQTTLVARVNGDLAGFVSGYLSQANSQQAYLRLVAVNPSHRRLGIARELYDQFFTNCSILGASEIRCTISPSNSDSIAFHLALGFQEAPSQYLRGAPTTENFGALGEERLLYIKVL